MEIAVFVVVLGALIYASVAWQRHAAKRNAEAYAAGRAMHLRSAAFPATCTWCKDTSLAHRLLVFERVDDRWHACEVRTRMAAAPDHALEQMVSAMFHAPSPHWRRFCTERCARAWFASENAAVEEAFGACAYCATRFPRSLSHCPGCGAGRTG